MKRASLEPMDLTFRESLIAFFLAILPPRLKVGVYKLGGAHIGRNVRIGIGSVVMAENFSKISIGDYTKIRNFTFIICKEVNIGKYVFIPMFVWIRGSGKLVIGNKGTFASRARIDLRVKNLYCEEFTGIAGSCIVDTHLNFFPYTQGGGHILKDIATEDYVFVALNSVILPGVTIEKNSIIGAGSAVDISVPPNSFVAGCPAKIISSNEKLKDKVDSKELKKRTLEIAKDLVDYFEFKLISEESVEDAYIITFERSKLLSKKVWQILVADASNPRHNKFFESFKGDNIILFSTSNVPTIIAQNTPVWYDLKNLKCCSLPDRFTRDIWHFLRNTWCVICDVKS